MHHGSRPAPHPASPTEVDGPVVAARRIEIAAPVELVWRVLTDIERWPLWNPGVRSASLEGDVAAGSRFRWRAGPARITSTIREVRPPQAIAWTGSSAGVAATHVWRLEERDGSTLVHTEEAFDGLVARLFRRALHRRLETSLADGLRALAREAEAQVTSAR